MFVRGSHQPVRMQAVIPVLRIFDRAKTREFYNEWLGFRTDWEHQFDDNAPLYLQISLDGLLLHLSEHHGDSTPGSKVILHVTQLDKFCGELTSKNYRYYRPAVEDAPWGAKIMEVIDPFGNRLLFNETQR